jgi:hypothetical protein
MANTALCRYIEILLVLEFDLVNNPRRADETFRVQIIINFEPSRVEDFFTLFDPSAIIDLNPLERIPQICAVISEKGILVDDFSTKSVERLRNGEVL